MLKRFRTRRPSSGQLRLFALIAPLRWTDLPPEVRERTVALLARLLRQHARTRHAAEMRGE